MKIKSLLNYATEFRFGKRVIKLTAGETTTLLNPTPEEIADARRYAAMSPAPLVVTTVGEPAAVVKRSYPRNATVLLAGVTATDQITIGGVTFTFAAGSGQTTSNVGIGANATEAATNLKAAINANATLIAAGVSAKDIFTVGSDARLTVELTGSLTVAPVSGDEARVNIAGVVKPAVEQVPVRQGVFSLAGGAAEFGLYTGFTSIASVVVQIRTNTNVLKAFDGAIYVSGGSIFLDDNGDVDIAATDTVTLTVVGT